MDEEMNPPAVEPKPIRRLNETLINKIAAGEIIHRPASALKELLENSLDAGATSIKVTVKDGGLKLLQIQDNGCGIRKSDLPILAERFTTSKLSSFSDLSRITTYGFRGEALASISHVAHLSVVTKTKGDSCAWKASYSDGSLLDPRTGNKTAGADATTAIRPCAGNDGTVITIENLFHTMPTRLSALRSPSEEYARILDVMTRYAVHNPHVGFVCKKAASPSPDLSTPTPSGSSETKPESSPEAVNTAIRLLYGSSIAKALAVAEISSNDLKAEERGKGKAKATEDDDDNMDIDEEDDAEDEDKDDDVDDDVTNTKGSAKTTIKTKKPWWSASLHFTNVNYQAKKMVFLLFVNHRLVDSPRLKRSLEGAYANVLPKGGSPFVYVSLFISPHLLDVNVHPTKREVHFMHEDVITARITDRVVEGLTGNGSGVGVGESREFEVRVIGGVQTLLTGGTLGSKSKSTSISKKRSRSERDGDMDDDAEFDGDKEVSVPTTSSMDEPRKIYSQHKVRTSMRDRTLDSMYRVVNPQVSASGSGSSSDLGVGASTKAGTVHGGQGAEGGTPVGSRTREIKESECFLTSVKDLRAKVGKGRHRLLSEVLESHTFIGIVDASRCLSLIQHSTRLYLVNHDALAEELFYQLALRQFGDLPHIRLDPPPSLREMIQIGVDAEPEESFTGTALDREQIVDRITELLMDASRREMLAEYFSLQISGEGRVESVPLLLRDYVPNLERLPGFLMRLGPQVDWTSETECFDLFLRELAYFYVPAPPTPTPEVIEENELEKGKGKQKETCEPSKPDPATSAHLWALQHILFPAFRRYLVPPKSLLDRDVVAVMQVADLPELYKVFERC